ncbi:protein N-terminal asparagine amidohydrolase isoform X2 [Musa acuminata AAA Group]|uniref:protein N-terminal asparagine amidohydrolase isoform X2 n=1 Tax=Musa acuminata AAA Group TaxID=214697 RepID=UPI0031D5716C
MIFVDGIPLSTSQVQMVRGSEILAALLDHPAVLSSSDRLKGTPEKKVSSAERPPPGRLVYIFQSEYATVDPALVQLVGTDEATTCVGLVIRCRNTGITSVSHMDFPGVVDNGLAQMLSSIADNDDDSDEASFDVHLIGGFDDGPKRHPINATVSERKQKKEGFSLPLCSKLIEALHNSQQKFHLQTLCVLRHNTKLDSCGNACPIVSGFLVDTSSDSIMPASFDRSSRGPDEIVRRIRVSLSSDDSNWKGRLLDTYDTCHDRFEIAPCTWMSEWKSYASSLQQLSDSEFLLRCSTSPYAEAPDFVESQRRKWNYLIENPDWRHTFTGKKPRIFQRTDDGGWSKCA